MESKIVTIIGGTGFIGRYVVRALVKQGYIVRVITRSVEPAKALKVAGDYGQVVLAPGNLSKPETLKPYMADSFAVINLVGLLFEKGRQKFATLHTEMPGTLATMAKAAGVKYFVQMSALGVDKSAARYAKTKLAGEAAVQKAFPTAAIIRPSVVFGAEDNFFNQFASMATQLHALPLIGGGKSKFQPVYVADVAAAIVACITQGKSGVFELGGPEVKSFKDILQFILHITQRRATLLPIPFCIASIMGAFASFLPKPPLTRDQVKLLKTDNVLTGAHPGLAKLGIAPTAMDMIVPQYLARFRKGAPK